MKLLYSSVALATLLSTAIFGDEKINIQEPTNMQTAVCVNVIKKVEDSFGAFPSEYKSIKNLCTNYPKYVQHFVTTFGAKDDLALDKLQLFTVRLPMKQSAVVDDLCENDYKGHEDVCYIYMKRILIQNNNQFNPSHPDKVADAIAFDINFKGAKNNINNYGIGATTYKTFVHAIINNDFRTADVMLDAHFKRYENDYFMAMAMPLPSEQ